MLLKGSQAEARFYMTARTIFVLPGGGARERVHERGRRYGSPGAIAGLRAAVGVLVVPRARAE